MYCPDIVPKVKTNMKRVVFILLSYLYILPHRINITENYLNYLYDISKEDAYLIKHQKT